MSSVESHNLVKKLRNQVNAYFLGATGKRMKDLVVDALDGLDCEKSPEALAVEIGTNQVLKGWLDQCNDKRELYAHDAIKGQKVVAATTISDIWAEFSQEYSIEAEAPSADSSASSSASSSSFHSYTSSSSSS